MDGAPGDDVVIVARGPARSSVIRFASCTGAVTPQLLRADDIDDVILVPSSPSSHDEEETQGPNREVAAEYHQLVAETVAEEDEALQTRGDDSVMMSDNSSMEDRIRKIN